jgi:hypothetical protein
VPSPVATSADATLESWTEDHISTAVNTASGSQSAIDSVEITPAADIIFMDFQVAEVLISMKKANQTKCAPEPEPADGLIVICFYLNHTFHGHSLKFT